MFFRRLIPIFCGLFICLGGVSSTLASGSLRLIEVELWTMGNFTLGFAGLLDQFSSIFIFTVIIITVRVLTFSYSYINTSDHFFKFHLLVLTFVSSILLLIISPNLVTLMLGWDGLGISSFFLVIFYKRNKAFNAGLITALTNRLGDAFIMISFTILWMAPTITLTLASLSGLSASYSLVVLIIAAARTKRAQVPFRAWLPAAIAAPTPVSALVHSSTLVTAGVYVLFRISPIFGPEVRAILGGLGAVTSLMARLAALLEADLKKIVALSTLRQLGVMMLRLRFSIPSIAFFHLIVHAFFKALLFVATGHIIHNSNDYQDLRRRGGNSLALPFTQGITILTKISLCGMPFFSAFYSKEWVLESLGRASQSRLVTYFVIWAGVGLTILYSLRFIFYVIMASRTLALVAKEDMDRFTMAASLNLVIPALITGKFILPRMLDSLSLPIVSFSAKVGVLTVLIVIAPVAFSLCSFISPKRSIKSFLCLFFLRSWRRAAPLFILSHFSSSSNSNRRFGWVDLVLVNWIVLLSEKTPTWSLNTRSFFKVLGRITVVLVVWNM